MAAQDQSYAAALGAADAGVDDLLYRLNANENTSFELADNIYTYDQQLASAPSISCPTSDTPALPPAACGWVTIPDDNDNARTMQYEYDVPSNHPPVPNGAATTVGATGTSLLVFDVAGRVDTSGGQTFTADDTGRPFPEHLSQLRLFHQRREPGSSAVRPGPELSGVA